MKLTKTSTEGSSQAVPTESDNDIANGNQHTPEKLADSYRPSGSPTRVSGTKVVASVKFTEATDRGLCKVDKSLVCKGFWETIEEAGRICLPRRSGKTYNLMQLLLFFSQSPEHEYLTSIPDSIIDSSLLSSSGIAQLDMTTKCRLKRELSAKDNKHLIKGLLFGVFEIPLTEMGSGANNIKDIRMVPTEENDIRGSILSASHPHSGSGMDALTDSFWFNTNEVELMLDNSTRWCAKIAQHKPLIIQTIRDWYNGYFIGRFRGKYNPWSVSSFIESLCLLLNQSDAEPCVDEIVKSAARPYWVTTGTTGLIEAQIDKHGPQFIRLAKRLLRNYEVAKLTKNTSQHLRKSSHVPLISTRLNLISMEQFSEPGLLTLCLFAGYLTRRHSTSVCIPNHEVYQVWLALFARAVMGTEMADNSTNYERGALLSELWQGKTDILCSLAISSHGVLSNHNKFLEKDYANHFANTILAVSRFGMLSHPQQQLVRLAHVVPIRENHSGLGKCDYIMLLYSTDNQPNQLGVVIEFKLITKDKRRDCKYHMERAQEAIKQIADRDYNTCLIGCLERIDIGVAIGNNVAYAIPKLYRRKTVDKPWQEVKSLVKRRR
ncbi:hypothetical protein IWW56_000790 [Coemansia sp. RSA 2131]|nr:hypothetical protein IWW56_000790 [Coemansia sp. RSA 2131]